MTESQYKAPDAEVPEEELPEYEIEKIKRYRFLMHCALLAVLITNFLFQVQEKKGPGLYESLLGFSFLSLIIVTTILASKTFKKIGFTLLFLVLAFIPIIQYFSCIYLGVRAKEIVRMNDRY